MDVGEEGERTPSESFWGVSSAPPRRGVDSVWTGLEESKVEEDRGLRDSDLEDGLVRGLGGFGGLVRGLRARDSRTSRCSASICLSYSAHMLHITSIFKI